MTETTVSDVHFKICEENDEVGPSEFDLCAGTFQ